MNELFPLVAGWFAGRYGEPTEPQVQGWPLIRAGRDVLISAPTGSGKTLAAFTTALDGLIRRAAAGPLPDEMLVVYVSPLKALTNDVRKNLETPLGELLELAGRAAPRAGADPHRDAHRRHDASRTRAHAAQAAARAGHHARVALHPAHGGKIARAVHPRRSDHRR